jgi:hypothetical protein
MPELYSVPLAGGSAVKLNGPLNECTTCYLDDFQISPDGRRVVYRTWQGATGYEFSDVPI